MADLMLARLMDAAAQFMTLVLVGAMLPGILLGLVLGLAAPAVWRWVAGKVQAWWSKDSPETLGIKAVVACARLPLQMRRPLIKGLRSMWGEGPFREVPQAPPPRAAKPEPKAAPDLPGVYTVHPAHGREH